MAHSSSRQHATAVLLRPGEATLTKADLAATFNEARPLVVPGPLRRAAVVVGDLLGAAGIVLSIPLAILAIGIPVALCVRLLLWIGGLL